MAATKKKRSRGLLYTAIILISLLLFAVYKVFGPNIGSRTQGDYLYIHTGASYEQVRTSLQQDGFVSDMGTFDILARLLKLPEHIHPGKYKIGSGMSTYHIIRLLHSGRQTPVKLVISKLRTKHDLVRLIGNSLEADSTSLTQMLNDTAYVAEFGFDTNTIMCAIIPDTYDFFWNTTADKAFRKIAKNYARFWDDTRRKEAHDQNLTPEKATIIASIVDEETNMATDKPKIASVYINRLHKNMLLQADPTVKFAVGDFTIRRIAGNMLQNPSPYNTYVHTGLPPGPICTPSASSVDAVLQAPETTYLYFCAKEDFSGYSNFASTYEEQLKNAHIYQQALNARGIH